MKLLVCGSRLFDDYDILAERLDSMIKYYDFNVECIIEGGAKGADSLAREYAIEHDIRYNEIPADWKKYGRKAGFIRNQWMLDELDKGVDYIAAFSVNQSVGTQHMIDIAKEAGHQVVVFKYVIQ